MNLPNKLTILRIILVPVYIVFMLVTAIPCHHIFATAVFVIASLTDMLDGKIARKYNLVTDFGKFADPLADKMLTVSAFVCLVAQGLMPAWICIVVVIREFAVSGLRLIAVDNGRVIAASPWGKFKTIFQMIYIIFATFNGSPSLNYFHFPKTWNFIYNLNTYAAMYIMLALTVISMVDYFVRNRKCFNTQK